MFHKTTKIRMTGLDVLPIKMTTRHIIYMENEYDEEINFFIQGHYSEIRNHFKERKYEFCYFPRMTDSELQHFLKEDYLPKGNLLLNSIALKSTLMYNCLSASDKENMLIPNASLFFCTSNPEGGPYKTSIYRILSLDKGSQWYLKNDFSNLLDDICIYLANSPDMPYDSEEPDYMADNTEYLASLPEPDFKDYDIEEVEREIALDMDEGSLRHDISKLREVTEEKIRQMNLMGHDSIFRYNLVRSYDEDAGYPMLIVRKDFSFAINDAVDDIILDLKDPIHKTVYLLFLNHPEGIRYEDIAKYKEEIVRIYKIFKPSYKYSDAGKKTVDNLIAIDGVYPPNLVQKISRLNRIIKKIIGNKKIAAGYMIQDIEKELKGITIANCGGVIWQNHI